jgi:hypothetical protein
MKWTKVFITTLQLNGIYICDGDLKGLKASKQKRKHQQDLAKFISTNHDGNKKYHGNKYEVLYFFQTTSKSQNVYKTLGRFNFYEWFTNIEKLKPIHIYLKWAMHLNKKTIMPILENYPKLKG